MDSVIISERSSGGYNAILFFTANDRNHSNREGEWCGSMGTAEPQKGEKMALGMVQTGYAKSLYMYPARCKTESEFSYAELLAELTTELELALMDKDEEAMKQEETGEDFEQTESHCERKKEWEELLEESIVVEVMLRQMLENGLGQREEAQQEKESKEHSGDLDNEFNLSGIPDIVEGRSKDNSESTKTPGNSEFLQQNAGEGTQHWSQTNAGRQSVRPHIICLTCETECDRKKQWKITE